ncbi:hypothetical protein NKR19_g1055 [Coniochaeta hoffmannii]|uniref:Uncharacterized protein n=1 Tax=Coniochaeta hoffmannii TaxID=91930 RepID=A0AA38SJ55_9PEZI|nr:hypothetical protein NKR19_g1055 [Coniochaeta hoffmannii]
MLYPVQSANKGADHWLNVGHARWTDVRIGDIILERSLINYKLLIEAFHLMRSRKAQLREEWKRQNPSRGRQLSFLPYEWTDTQIKQCRYEVGAWKELATFELTTTGEVLPDSPVNRRLVLRRDYVGRTDYWEEPLMTYISVASGRRVALRTTDIVLPETEYVYSRLAYFFAATEAADWQVSRGIVSVPRVPDSKPETEISQRNLA